MEEGSQDTLKPHWLMLLALISGGLLAVAQSLTPAWWSLWLGVALLVATIILAPPERRRLYGLVAGALSGLLVLRYHIMIAGGIMATLILLAKAYLWASAAKHTADTYHRGQTILALLPLPLAWAAIETLMIHLSPHGSISSLAYSQMDALAVLQLASLGGAPAVTAFVLLVATAIGFLLARLLGAVTNGVFGAAAIGVAVGILGISFGVMRLATPLQPSGLVAVTIASDAYRKPAQDWKSFDDRYGAALGEHLEGNKVVVLPEAIVQTSLSGAKDFAAQLSTLTAAGKAAIIVGVVVEEETRTTNRALVAQGGAAHWYEKQKLIPGLESSMSPGNTPLITERGIAAAICKDMHFPTVARAYAPKSPTLYVVPANDFRVDKKMMARATALRSTELGIPLIRATRNGNSFVTDSLGRTIAEQTTSEMITFVTAEISTPLSHPTLYRRFGDVFGWICVLLFGVQFIWLRFMQRDS